MKAPAWVFYLALPLIPFMIGLVWLHSSHVRVDQGMVTSNLHAPDGTDAGQCPVRWARDQLPVRVYLDHFAAEYEPWVRDSVTFWNAKIGAEVLVYDGQVQDVEHVDGISISESFSARDFTVNADEGGQATPYFDATCRLTREQILIRGDPTRTDGFRQKLMRHEFGHTEGLGHDDREESVMRPDLRWVGDLVSDQDLGQLRAACAH